MGMELNEVDYNAKKSVEELSEKMEVERCVIEMVSWVTDQIQNNETNDRLNKVKNSIKASKKSSDVQEKVPEQKLSMNTMAAPVKPVSTAPSQQKPITPASEKNSQKGIAQE